MTQWRGFLKKHKAKWFLTVNDNGTVNFTLQVRGVRVRPQKKNRFYVAVDILEQLPVELSLEGFKCRPRFLGRLYMRPSEIQRQKLEWGVIRKLTNRRHAGPPDTSR